jgi:hypothetical protein
MNEFKEIASQYKSLRKLMNKNETIEIKSLQNGYLVERNWREKSGSKDDVLDYRYCDEKFVFLTWDEVIEFVSKNKLDVPPAKI